MTSVILDWIQAAIWGVLLGTDQPPIVTAIIGLNLALAFAVCVRDALRREREARP